MTTSWYYASGGHRVGPVTEVELDNLISSGVVGGDTLVWREGLPEWQPLNTARPDAPPSAPAAVPIATLESPTRFCSECGQARLERELVNFGGRVVCYACKDAFTQKVREQGGFTQRFAYAGFWIRFVARLLDAILLYIVILPVTFLVLGSAAFTVSSEPSSSSLFTWLLFLFQIVLSATYEVWFLTRYGATPGKMVVSKKVVMADGGPLSTGRALGRHFAVYLSSFTLTIGFVMAAFDDQKRALHDRICDTRVIAK